MKKVRMSILIVFSLVVVGVLNCGCMEKPKVTVDSFDFTGIGYDTTKLNVRVIVDNPYPVGAHVNKISFKIFYKNNNGELKYLGEGEKYNVDIVSGKNVIDIPVTLSNKELIRALGENIHNKYLKLEVDGYANIDLKVTSINVPFKREKTVKLPDNIARELEILKSMGVGFDIKDFKKPKITVDSVHFDNDILVEPKLNIGPEGVIPGGTIKLEHAIDLKKCNLNVYLKIYNPNPIDIDIKKLVVYIYGNNRFLGNGTANNIHIIKNGITTYPVKVEILNTNALLCILDSLSNDEDKIIINVSGEVYIKDINGVKIPPVPFNKQREVELPDKLKPEYLRALIKSRLDEISNKEENTHPILDNAKNIINEGRQTINNEISSTVQSLNQQNEPESYNTNNNEQNQAEETQYATYKYLYIYVYPNNVKVGDTVTIKVVDSYGNPVEGATVIIDGIIRKTTDNYGEVFHTFKIGGTHTIKVEKPGYYQNEVSIYVERVVNQLDIRDRANDLINSWR